MSTSYPSNLDDFLNPIGTDILDNANPALKHATQHDDANDAIEAIEAKLGVDSSANTTTIDYKIRKGSFIRNTATVQTDLIVAAANDITKNLPTVGKGCTVIRIATDYPAWVRIYASEAARTADAAREQTTDPTAGSGVLLDVATVAGALSIDLSPAVFLASLESSPATYLPITVTNNDTGSRAITVTVTLIPTEG